MLAPPGVAQVSDGGRPVGTLQLASQADWAIDALWAGSLGMAGWLAVLGAASAALAAPAVRSRAGLWTQRWPRLRRLKSGASFSRPSRLCPSLGA